MRAPPPSRPLAATLLIASLLGVALVVFAPHVAHGGFYADDWSRAAAFRFDGYRRLALEEWRNAIPGRPVLAWLIPLPYALLGLDPRWHLAAAVVLAAAASIAFFALLRTLAVPFVHALGFAVLSFVFPWSGAARLWPSAAINNVAVIAYFLGTIAALRAFEARERRPRALDALAGMLYLLSVLTYEVAAAAILCSGLLYRSRAPWRAVRTRWLRDVALVLVPLTVSLVVTSRVRHVGSPTERLSEIPRFVREDLSIFASSLLPEASASAPAKVAVVLVTLAVVGGALARARGPEERWTRRWLPGWGLGVGVVALAHVMFLGSGLFPHDSGIGDRTNIFAAYGFVLTAYSTLALLAPLVAGRRAGALLLVATTLMGLAWVQRVRADVARYDAAPALQRDLLARLRRALPPAEPSGVVISFGYPGFAAPGIPIFSHSWDLSGALSLERNDRTIEAVPVYRLGIVCGRDGIRAAQLEDAPPGRYGSAIFVDLSSLRSLRVRSRRECLRARRLFPVEAAD